MSADQSKNWIVIGDEEPGFPLRHFVIPSHYKDDVERVLIPHGMIMDRVEKLANEIAADTEGPLTVCCILKGGHAFFADLVNRLKKCTNAAGQNLPMQLDFIKVKSYEGDKSSGNVTISYTEQELHDLKGKHLLLVEDIIDTGATMTALLAKLAEYQPASVRVVSLFLKRTPKSVGYIPDYVGVEIPDQFIVGYCLDYNEMFRDLDHVCVISETGKQKYA
ncbi:hypoxanthine phosphoribosyltransferase [Allomyces macrogynus ATCC 38327]|uniref:Hypoxanthine phosphoribosyltransferase n=1 Tax=Allomyces macrogynus (strain ATCC 38327) TaxID=578462 RepID=A0A0L0SCY9_ALLM3|nr:hypoxanthine phosphoribosyltransferase [Allomyces macrogynus ATCC 38327]|eukprot:KNE60408.1 hypoxanthine phosphoribosyltransferase [Allomyces macrogynus ATCC 38327]